ncbi:ArsJ-associated glyceraldehyde-3-phosphate dehydrogenase [Maribius pontilimi]|uniref:Glyceraldehyde-3-phosphate dehydrogenase n=1 Tax=Palleronia pontilimi TaxID=1964209 RepID=A0A934IA36_9RHOB|nr:ArsJ-associated glyceraldehyde-3-phosphate dehydrogenase [Palleronia pontilimi]MBJ3763299.1 ArsJ-associated glyceraldehyde-3-phosphate dehydrogenase [Palleronia pontilimi]
MTNIAINGLGRIGKLLLRALFDAGLGGRIAALNDRMGDAEQHALLLEFDTVHGRWPRAIGHAPGRLTVEGHTMALGNAAQIEDMDLAGIDLVIDCTGTFKSVARVQPYFDAGVDRVLVSAPIKEEGALNLVYGVNHALYDGTQKLVTAASCTTNCLAPVIKVLHDSVGIRHGSITTLHDVTNTQTIVDRPAKDMRRARSALNALIPTTTGSATAITVIYPELAGRLNGHAVRVPLLNASLTDCVFEMQRAVTADEVNALFRDAAEGALKGILGVEDRPLVSTDFVNDPRSAIIDTLSTMVVNDTQLKVYAWYDNEWGYACRMADIAAMMS